MPESHDLRTIQDELAEPSDRVEAMRRAARAHPDGLHALISPLLLAPSGVLRCESLQVLLIQLHREEFIDTCLLWLRADPDPMVRTAAAGIAALAVRLVTTRRHDIVRTLLLGLLEDPDHLVQGACYAALVRLLTNAIHTAIPERFSLETDVDWGVLRPEIERFGLNEGQNWAQRLESAL